VHVDNKSIVDSLTYVVLDINQDSTIASHIFLLLHNFEEDIFKHVFRETNKCTNFLGKLNLPSAIEEIWIDIFSPELKQ
jgi:hypothetical protein